MCFNHLITLMKKIYSYLSITAFSFLTLTACSSDDNTPTPEPQQPTNYLLGKWNATSTHMKLVIDGEVVLDELDKETTMRGMIKTYEFKNDNTVNHYTYIPAGTNTEEVDRHGTTTYERNGNQLILKNYPAPYSILLLDDKKMQLHTKDEFEYDGKIYILENLDKFERVK
ncbi:MULTISPECIES: hypothetical protein [unclassified Flavobacterium]|uniref:hypothetical protein n=1 Tax=unclassified Flavobacterium TaxID=196869 RepID=UPI0013CFC4A9|nr:MULTISPECIES: hypothetical protein [unclassified Flavobacterium]MBA5792496.1 hypothetical protein [Flavobacterium sp. xlx-221]